MKQFITFDDIVTINNEFPTILAPVFILQAKMMDRYMGELWWRSKVKITRNKRVAVLAVPTSVNVYTMR